MHNIILPITYKTDLQEEAELCLMTAQLEDFVLQFLDRWVARVLVLCIGMIGLCMLWYLYTALSSLVLMLFTDTL